MIKVAILVAHEVQDQEMLEPLEVFSKEPFQCDVILCPKKKIKNPTTKNGQPLTWTKTAEEVVKSGDFKYDLLLCVGGWAPEIIRLDKEAMCIVRYNIDSDSLIGSICHGCLILLSARTLPKGMKLTGYPASSHDIVNAGYVYPYENVVVDRNVVSCSHYKYNSIWIQTILEILTEKFPEYNLPYSKRLIKPYYKEYEYNINA